MVTTINNMRTLCELHGLTRERSDIVDLYMLLHTPISKGEDDHVNQLVAQLLHSLGSKQQFDPEVSSITDIGYILAIKTDIHMIY